MKVAASVVVVLVTWVSACWADEGVTIHNGFITGNHYLAFPSSAQKGYAMGLVDGMLLSPFFGAPKLGKLATFETCVEGMSNSQVLAILAKWLNDHPEKWHEWMHTLSYAALVEACDL